MCSYRVSYVKANWRISHIMIMTNKYFLERIPVTLRMDFKTNVDLNITFNSERG
ncbi:unnamed protein product [Acanthoscelides obtectus]|uniref:Uncharacterized protein n=1 Tax=Acanthoscelides obtectus TaxID=200917 RepID=A0A9P0PKX6_ACAOB|nr:unnamed protein product [Acanthoscelides obtectus]CAK1622174.1 hypothetical protein AOBTE_LOCUS1350 [Acanthoscelides obtectus]